MQKILTALNKRYIKVVAYLLLVAALSAVFFAHGMVIKTDILALMPDTEENSVRQEALSHVSLSMNQINILFGAADTSQSKAAGLYFQSLLTADTMLEVNYEAGTAERVLIDKFSLYNYHLLSDNYKALMLDGDGEFILQSALAGLYSPIGFNIAGFERDPFLLLTDYMLNNSLLSTNFSMSDSVFVTSYEDRIYSYMSVKVLPSVMFSPSALSDVMQLIYESAADTKSHFDVDINITGIPVHTYYASSGSVKEINIISIVSFIVILLISIFALRSPMGFITSVVTIAVSFAVAFMLVNIILGEIHVFTLVFGTSLIGLCIDYCLHYFVERGCETDSDIALRKIIKAVTLSLATSLIGFTVLLTSSMLLMKQIALFSMSGLICAFLIIIVFYPLIFRRLSFSEPPLALRNIESTATSLYARLFSKRRYVLMLFIIALSLAGILKLRINDGIQHLYTPNPDLLRAERFFADVTGYNISSAFFFITGDSAEEILQTEEELIAQLKTEIDNGVLQGYKGISSLVPSVKTQAENYALAADFFDEYGQVLLDTTGLSMDSFSKIRQNMLEQVGSYLLVDDLLVLEHMESLKSIWTGKGSFLFLEGLTDTKVLEKYQGGNIYYLDKIDDYNNMLAGYRYKATIMVIASYILIAFIMIWRYGLRLGLLTLMPASLAIVFILAGFGYAGVGISFFHVIGLFLVLCFGLDYTVFQVETKGKLKYSGVAVMLSCLTTLASFGLMAFTSFEVTRALGLTLFAGILLSYIFSFIPKVLARREINPEEK